MRQPATRTNAARDRAASNKIDISKPPEPTSSTSAFGVGATRELGSLGGITVTEDARVDIASIASPQKISGSINVSEQSAQVEIELGVKKGFGVSFGGEIKRTPTGIEPSNVSFGVNVLGFGVNAEGKGSESSKIGISAFGAKVEIASDAEGKTSVRLGFELPGFGVGITLQPDGKKTQEPLPENLNPKPPTPPPQPNDPIAPLPPAAPSLPELPAGKLSFCKVVVETESRSFAWTGDYASGGRSWAYQFGDNNIRRSEVDAEYVNRNGVFILEGNVSVYDRNHHFHTYPVDFDGSHPESFSEARNLLAIPVDPYPDRLHPSYVAQGLEVRSIGGDAYELKGNENKIYAYINSKNVNRNSRTEPCGAWTFCQSTSTNEHRIRLNLCVIPSPTLVPQDLPNYPQEYTPMNCCDKVEEIYKYLGIAKIKKHKMKIAKAFLAPGGKGTEDCEDFYEITQALFRMLANGLIINPKSKPLGSDWQNANATAWASSMYEMMAETMSDGNTSQRFEISAMMQMAQMMAAIAESTRKIEFVADGLGFEPNLVSEELPISFTIYEKHKGFGKFDPKKINISKISTDEQAEKILGAMLNPSKIPIVKWQLKSGETTIKEQLNG